MGVENAKNEIAKMVEEVIMRIERAKAHINRSNTEQAVFNLEQLRDELRQWIK